MSRHRGTPRAEGRGGDGGIAARRAVVRWAWRMFRREWRQQAVVLALLTVAVAAAIGTGAATHATVGVREDATFGAANHRYTVDTDGRGPGVLDAGIAAAAERFGAVGVVAEWDAPIPGSVDSLAYRAQAPDGPFAGPMLALRDGRYPAGRGEVAVTDGVAATLQLGVGDTLALDGTRRTIVGLVENPSDLGAEFALAAPGDRADAEAVTVLVGGTGRFAEVRALRDFGAEHLPEAELTSRDDVAADRAAAVVLGVAVVVLVLVSLVASAGFVAVAQRRMRQLGMLGAVGATERHLRLVVVANGVAVGVTAALAGTAAGVGAWFAAAPRMEASAGFRIAPAELPWWLVAATVAAVVATSTAAAWWPARAVARVPATLALSGRPPAPRPARRSASAAAVLVTAGVVALVAADRRNAALVGLGAVATVAGVLALAPLALQALAAVARPLPVAVRLALRDLSRYRARSAVALAAVALALGIPVAVVVTASAAEAGAELGNLPPDRLLVWTRGPDQPEGESPFYTVDPDDEGFAPYLPDLGPGDLAGMAAAVTGPAGDVGAEVVPLEVATDPSASDDPEGDRAVTLARPTDVGYLDVALLYVAAPELLAPYGLAPPDLDAAEVVTTAPDGPPEVVVDTGELWLANTAEPPAAVPAGRATIVTPSHSSLPGSFVSPAAVTGRGWSTRVVGWLLASDEPFTDAQVAAVRDVASAEGLLVEEARERASLVALRWGATGAGLAVALAVLAMTVGIVRAQSAGDVRALTATGATSAVRRGLTASTAGGLAALGAVLGTLGAYLALAAGFVGDPATLAPVPVAHLAVIVLGAPAVAALAGWALAGRPPPALARQPLE